MKHVHFVSSHVRTIVATGVFIGMLIIASAPQPTFAATFAYVNQSGDVNIVVANSPMAALLTAVNIGIHSGVLLLSSTHNYALVGGKIISI